MLPFRRKPKPGVHRRQQAEEALLAATLRPLNCLPGFIIGFLLGLLADFVKSSLQNPNYNKSLAASNHASFDDGGNCASDKLKMVLVVRQDLKMGAGKIASQCAHAATGMYAELLQSHQSLLKQWKQTGQQIIVVSCKNQQEMNRLKDTADQYGLPTFIVSDAGHTQVQVGSKTVLAIGPGKKTAVDSVTCKQHLL